MLDGVAEIEEFVARFEGRGPGTDAERRAARYLAERLEAIGRAAETEPAWVWPNYPLTYVAQTILAVLASVVSTANGIVGAAIAAVVVVSAAGDMSGRVYLLRRLTRRRATQTVVSREDGGEPGTLVLVAHYDAPRGGAMLGGAARRLRRLPIGPLDAYVAALTGVLAVTVLRAGGVTGTAIAALQFVSTALLIVAVPVLVDVALAATVPGASDNASGVATVLRLAARYGGTLDHFRVWVLFPGASEGLQLGMRAWVKRHRRELDPRRTIFLNVDGVGSGTVRYLTREGFVLTRRSHPRLVELCEVIAEEDTGEQRYGVRRLAARSASDATPAAAAGFPTISVSCRGANGEVANARTPSDTPDRIDPLALERAFRFCSELIELIDERIGPDIAAVAARAGAEPRA